MRELIDTSVASTGLARNAPAMVDLCQMLDQLAQRTANGTGWAVSVLLPDNEDSRFIRQAASLSRPVVDIGCGYGVHARAFLEAGAEVIAIDPSAEHLSVLQSAVSPRLASRLRTIQGKFPDVDIENGSAGAIFAGRVAHFWDGELLQFAISRMFDILAPGGQVCLIETWPFWRALYAFAPEYQRRLACGQRWAGEMDMSIYEPAWVEKGVVPGLMHYLTSDILEDAFLFAGFEIKRKAPQFVRDLPNLEVGCAIIAEKP